MTAPQARGATDIVALIPAAGFATRLGSIPCSKELLPVGWSADSSPRAAGSGDPLASYLLRRLVGGGIRRALLILRHDKSDIPQALGDGSRWGVELDYLFVEPTGSTVETLDAAYSRVHGMTVALGYPDIVFRPTDAYARVVARLSEGGADIALGLFPSSQPERSDMVEFGADGTVEGLVIKQPDRGLPFTWSIAVWTPAFTDFLHDFRLDTAASERELYVGDVIRAAIDSGMRVAATAFEDGESTDLGTPEALSRPPAWVLQF